MVDLKVNRRESGLSNKDLAHLLNVDASRISKLENGHGTIAVSEMCALSLIYGKGIEGLFAEVTTNVAQKMRQRMAEMPNEPDGWKLHKQRLDTLNALTQRLFELTLPSYEI